MNDFLETDLLKERSPLPAPFAILSRNIHAPGERTSKEFKRENFEDAREPSLLPRPANVCETFSKRIQFPDMPSGINDSSVLAELRPGFVTLRAKNHPYNPPETPRKFQRAPGRCACDIPAPVDRKAEALSRPSSRAPKSCEYLCYKRGRESISPKELLFH